MINIKNYILLIRPLNILISGLAMVVSTAILDSLHETRILVLIVLIVISYTAAANAINDVLDLEIDKVNRPFRPIPSKNLRKGTALNFSFILFFIGSILSLQLSSAAQFISIVISMPLAPNFKLLININLSIVLHFPLTKTFRRSFSFDVRVIFLLFFQTIDNSESYKISPN